MYGFYLLAADLKFHDVLCADLPLTDAPAAGHNDEKLPLGVVPVQTFRHAGLGDIHGKLTAALRFQQLREEIGRAHV